MKGPHALKWSSYPISVYYIFLKPSTFRGVQKGEDQRSFTRRCRMSPFVLKRHCMPDLKGFGNRIDVENLDHGFRWARLEGQPSR
jgi:hypothetical protein